jgi:hypothetical protein
MHQFLSDESTPTLDSGSNAAEIGGSRSFWRRKKKGRTDKVLELERA